MAAAQVEVGTVREMAVDVGPASEATAAAGREGEAAARVKVGMAGGWVVGEGWAALAAMGKATAGGAAAAAAAAGRRASW